MKKLKLLVLGIGLAGMAGFGISYTGASEAEAQQTFKCEWNGSTCLDPQRTNICGCEEGPIEQ